MNWDTLSEPQRLRVKKWQLWMLALAIVCEIFLAADWYAFAAVIPFISGDLGLSPGEAGLAQGIFALTYGIGMVVWSPVSRTMSARQMLLIGLAGTGLGMVLQIFVQNYAQLITLRLIIGFFDAAIFIGNMKLIFGWFPQRRRGAIVGMILAAYSLAITLDFALGIPLTLEHGWRVFFAVLATGTLIVAAINGLFARNGPAELGLPGFAWEPAQPHAHLPLGEIFRTRWIAVAGLGIGACTFAIAGTATWVIPAFIAFQGMAPDPYAAIVGTMMGVSQVVFLVIGGYMADKMAKTTLIKVGAVLALLTAVMFTAATIYPMGLGTLMLMAAVSGLAVLSGGAIFSLLSEKYPVALAPAAVGYAEVFGILSSFLSPWVMGMVIGASGGSFTNGFLVFTIGEALFLVALLVLAREGKGRTAAIQPAE